jgi:hypothetical protein
MNAPHDVLLWYLAIFHRLFSAMENAAAEGDREAMWVCQWAADALHNVPAMLRRYERTSEWHDPARFERQIKRFPRFLVRLGGPGRVRALAAKLVSRRGIEEELGLKPDGSDLDLAPDDELDCGLQRLYDYCLDTRHRCPWQALSEPDGWRDSEFQGRNNGLLGAVAKRLPRGLVRWSTFDLQQFEAELAAMRGKWERWDPGTRSREAPGR